VHKIAIDLAQPGNPAPNLERRIAAFRSEPEADATPVSSTIQRGFTMVDVRVIPATERAPDRHYMMIVHEDRGMIVDADRGSTDLVELDEEEHETGTDRQAAILEGAKRVAEQLRIPVIYLLDYPQWHSGDPIPLPE
jgi:hypothetical protein